MEKTTYSVIGILHGYVEQQEIADETAALLHAKNLVNRGARCVEIYDAADRLMWASEPDEYDRNAIATHRTFPNVRHLTTEGHPDWVAELTG